MWAVLHFFIKLSLSFLHLRHVGCMAGLSLVSVWMCGLAGDFPLNAWPGMVPQQARVLWRFLVAKISLHSLCCPFPVALVRVLGQLLWTWVAGGIPTSCLCFPVAASRLSFHASPLLVQSQGLMCLQ